ncbi:TlpA disulfide reductase family protein [Pedobacter frigoris]|uniref:TlpA disulfide reductase family protein n=1 Tax=Pedobacter frigoris TaxID=2571272 RepID=UPI00292E8CFF|nr:TlpA disulfide reductase family protein [Pedobacter frigoris]
MKTKIMMLCFALFFNVAISFAQKSQGFVLSGKFKSLPDGTKVYLVNDDKDTVGRVISKGNEVIFKGTLPLNGRFHFILFDALVSTVATKSMLLENTSMQVTGELGKADIVLKGSNSDANNKELSILMNPIRQRMLAKNKELVQSQIQIRAKLSNSTDSIEKTELTKKLEELTNDGLQSGKEFKDVGLNWLMAHNNSLYTPFVVSNYRTILSADEMQAAYDNLTPDVKAGYYANKLKNDIYNRGATAKIAEGQVIHDFMLARPDGKKESILEIASKSKYTLIDCWASWCSPCRAEVPALKKIYAAFKDKGFGVVGISSDKDISKWKKAVVEDATPWFHLVESDKKEISNTYDIRAIPAYMLIDDKGRLVAFDCQMSNVKPFGPLLRGEELTKTLEGLLGK